MTVGDVIPLAMLGAVLGLDVVSFPQAMISRPIVAATLAGALVGDAGMGLFIGAVLELFALEMLAVGAARYPEWGSAAVVGGALFASEPHADSRATATALAASVSAALVIAWLGGWSMYALRRLNGAAAKRRLAALDRGSRDAVLALQLGGLSADLARGAILTGLALAALAPLSARVARVWAVEPGLSEVAILGLACAAAGSASWRLFRGTSGARRLFAAGIAIGVALLMFR
ncbi:MAG: PTS sugar transporter subunit IIC [Gemmatimonadaceae bacterium]